MNDIERIALVWLEQTISDPNAYESTRRNARTLLAMLLAQIDREDRARWYVETFPV